MEKRKSGESAKGGVAKTRARVSVGENAAQAQSEGHVGGGGAGSPIPDCLRAFEG